MARLSWKYLTATAAIGLVALVAGCTEQGSLVSAPEQAPDTAAAAAPGGSGWEAIGLGDFTRVVEVPTGEVCKIGSAATFEVSIDGGPAEILELQNGECAPVAFDNNDVQTVTVTEVDATDGFDIDSIVRDTFAIEPDGDVVHSVATVLSTSTATLIVSANTAGRLTFFNGNTAPPMRALTVCKNGSAAQFNLAIGTQTGTTTVNDGQCKVVYLGEPGAARVTEVVPTGYEVGSIVINPGNGTAPVTLTGTNVAQFNMSGAGNATVTFNNRLIPPPVQRNVTVCKQGTAGSFQVMVNGGPPNGGVSEHQLAQGECKVVHVTTSSDNVEVIEHAQQEVVLERIEVAVAGQAPTVVTGSMSTSVTAVAGGVTLTFFNKHNPPPPPLPRKIRVCKIGPGATFNATVNGEAMSFPLADGECKIVFESIDGSAGTATVTENVPAGFRLDSIYIVPAEGDPITLTGTTTATATTGAPGTGSVITFFNHEIPPPPPAKTLTVCKKGSSASFSMSANGGASSSFSLGDHECRVVHTTTPGGTSSVVVTENVPSGTVLDSIVIGSVGATGTKITGATAATATVTPDGNVVMTFYNKKVHTPPPGSNITLCKRGSSGRFMIKEGHQRRYVTLAQDECRVIEETPAHDWDVLTITEIVSNRHKVDSIIAQPVPASAWHRTKRINRTSITVFSTSHVGQVVTFYNKVLPPPPPPPTTIKLCKVGVTGYFTITKNSHTSNVTYNNRDCDVIATSAPGGSVTATILEKWSSSYSLDSIIVTTVPSNGGTPTRSKRTGTTSVQVTATPSASIIVTFYNRRSYTPPPRNDEGCSPGYWKNHTRSWPYPYRPDTKFSSVFENAFPNRTLAQVLALQGGGLNALGRQAVAALLNAQSSNVDYALSTSQVISAFNGVFPGGDYEAKKNWFEDFNLQDCPCD